MELTGGEPLLQPAAPFLAKMLLDAGYQVLIETSGAQDISVLDARVIKIMDLKCPGSGECHRNRYENIKFLNRRDEVKFVIANREDYLWARIMTEEHLLKVGCTVLYSPVFGVLDNQTLASWILNDQLPVRFQIQLHKYIWDPQQRGV